MKYVLRSNLGLFFDLKEGFWLKKNSNQVSLIDASLRTCWYDVSQENEQGTARIIAGFIGTVKSYGRSELTESSELQILVETEDDTFSSKVVQSENGRTVFNEGFMLMNKISEKKICLKIMDSENGNKLGQRYLNLWEIKKLPKWLEINTEKV